MYRKKMITDKLRTTDILALLAIESDPCISIYLPTHRRGAQTREDPIRFKNSLRQCEKRLHERGISSEKACRLLRPGHELLESSIVWRHLESALAVFISTELSRAFTLPIECQEQMWMGRHFHTKPLVPLCGRENRFHVLALSRGHVALYEADGWAMRRITLDDAPENLRDFLKYDEAEEHLQYHTAPRGKSAGTAAIFHGHGNIADRARRKKTVDEYVKAVRNAVERHLAAEHCPLVLVAPEYIQSTYRQVSHYSHLLPEGVQQTPDHLSETDLYEAACAIADDHFRQTIRDHLESYQALLGTGYASDQIEKLAPAARQGRIQTLLLDPAVSLQEKSGNASESEEELLDEVVRCTLAQGGKVYAVNHQDMPSRSPAGAIFRH